MTGARLGVGETLGPFRLEALLGEGSMGVVYRARDASRETTVALKVLRQDLAADAVYKRRFAHEARAAAEVEHDHLVPVLDSGTLEGHTFLVMTYVRSTSLEERIEDSGPLSADEVVRLAAQVGSGLDALHRRGLVHRDVKPSNVLLDSRGDAFLTDFGLAKGRAYTVLTAPGKPMGTIDYMAPELIRGEGATPLTDVYALGCMVYQCIAGRAPFADKSIFEVAAAHLSEEAADPRSERSELPSELSWAILKALAKDPSERPSTGVMYARMLKAASRGAR